MNAEKVKVEVLGELRDVLSLVPPRWRFRISRRLNSAAAAAEFKKGFAAAAKAAAEAAAVEVQLLWELFYTAAAAEAALNAAEAGNRELVAFFSARLQKAAIRAHDEYEDWLESQSSDF